MAKFKTQLLAVGAVFIAMASGVGSVAYGSQKPKTAQPVKEGKITYKEGKTVRFDGLEIQGALQRPDTLIVTGDAQDDGKGLLRLRTQFLDRQFSELGLEIPSNERKQK